MKSQAPSATVDGNALAAAHEEPTLTLGSIVYHGRVLSIEEWLPFFEERIELEAATAALRKGKKMPDMRAWIRHWVRYLSAVFPRSRFHFWAPNPVAALRQLPGRGLQEAYEGFFYHQGRELGFFPKSAAPVPAAETPQPTPPGSDLPSRTDDGVAIEGGA
jgi:hypothetical protein